MYIFEYTYIYITVEIEFVYLYNIFTELIVLYRIAVHRFKIHDEVCLK